MGVKSLGSINDIYDYGQPNKRENDKEPVTGNKANQRFPQSISEYDK